MAMRANTHLRPYDHCYSFAVVADPCVCRRPTLGIVAHPSPEYMFWVMICRGRGAWGEGTSGLLLQRGFNGSNGFLTDRADRSDSVESVSQSALSVEVSLSY